jgi:HK97 family phage major capsid protein
MRARQGLKQLFRAGHVDRIEPKFRKSVSAFSFGNSGFLLAPEMSDRVLSCIVDPTDLSGSVDSITISGPSIRFLIDNARMMLASWSCEANCFANNPQPDLQEGLGELNIKSESLRYVVCATSDLLADASMNVEAWILDKVSRGMRATINAAILLGDGAGKPLICGRGNSICDVSPATAPGHYSWQDLLMLRYEIPLQWQLGCSYLMNQRTFALLQTMSSAEGRPLFGPQGTTTPGTGFSFAGSPINIVSQMPA